MAWLSGWLKELISLVLLATFAELLLPSQTMQKYARTVIGLLLVMVLLTPLFKVFQGNWDTDSMLNAAEQMMVKGKQSTAASARADTRLQDILKDAARLQGAQAKEAQLSVEKQLSASVKTGIEQQLGLVVDTVKTTTRLEEGKTLTVLDVQVVLSSAPKTPAASSLPSGMRPIEPIEPVQPVTIDIRTGSEVPRKSNKEAIRSAPEEQAKPVKEWIAKEYQIESSKVRVVVSSAA